MVLMQYVETSLKNAIWMGAFVVQTQMSSLHIGYLAQQNLQNYHNTTNCMTLGCVFHCVCVGVSVSGDVIGSHSRRGELYLSACTRDVKKPNLNNMNLHQCKHVKFELAHSKNYHICNHSGHCLRAWEAAWNLMEADALQIHLDHTIPLSPCDKSSGKLTCCPCDSLSFDGTCICLTLLSYNCGSSPLGGSLKTENKQCLLSLF